MSPADPGANFVALLLEDYADEWLWRPAMHYRWSYPDSAELARYGLSEHLPVDDVPQEQKQAFWKERQLGTFVKGDGVTDDNREAVESSYLSALTALESIFQTRDYILGDRPTQADFGFMGPMFRHFFCDPNPARIMRDTAPAVQEWVARMWNIKPQRFSAAAPIVAISDDLQALLEPVFAAYLPYLQANELAVVKRQPECSYQALGCNFTEPSKPYRLWCLDQLRRQYQALERAAKQQVNTLMSDTAAALLAMRASGSCDYLVPVLPITSTPVAKTAYDSWGRIAGD